MLTGEVGMGKTLVCRYLVAVSSERRALCVSLESRPIVCGSAGFHLLGTSPGRSTEDRSIGALATHRCLTCCCSWPGRVNVWLVLVDEAHRLSGKVLEGLRLLSNLDTEKEKLMCLLFVGQPELERTLSHRALRPLAQRISVRFRLKPFDCRETVGYIRHRLLVTGRDDSVPISARAS